MAQIIDKLWVASEGSQTLQRRLAAGFFEKIWAKGLEKYDEVGRDCNPKLLVRFEKQAANALALVQLACATIVWRKLMPVHR